jgi:nucleoside-diphosphate-sugar epimerase
MPDQTILVTGAAGFIGFHAARQLLAAGRTVVGLDNLNSYYDLALKQARLNILRGDSRFSFVQIDRASIAELFARNRSARVLRPYAATKKANEMMAHSYSHLYRLPSTGLRFSTVCGPWGRQPVGVKAL